MKGLSQGVVVQHIPSHEKLVDTLTKSLFIQAFLKMCSKHSIIKPPLSLRKGDKSHTKLATDDNACSAAKPSTSMLAHEDSSCVYQAPQTTSNCCIIKKQEISCDA